jgi:hypothetical protein
MESVLLMPFKALPAKCLQRQPNLSSKLAVNGNLPQWPTFPHLKPLPSKIEEHSNAAYKLVHHAYIPLYYSRNT